MPRLRIRSIQSAADAAMASGRPRLRPLATPDRSRLDALVRFLRLRSPRPDAELAEPGDKCLRLELLLGRAVVAGVPQGPAHRHGEDRPELRPGSSGKGNNTTIVRAMIGLGSNLRIDVLAEGGETAEQAAFLRTCVRSASGFPRLRPRRVGVGLSRRDTDRHRLLRPPCHPRPRDGLGPTNRFSHTF